jgi:hypothetical protein
MTSTVLACSSLMTMGFTGIAHAAAGSDTCTWTGATDSKFSTATNWSGCSSGAPVNGDNLVFDATSLSADATPANDINSLSVGTITFQGSGSYEYAIGGSEITVGSAIVVSTGHPTISADLTLGADVTLSGAGYLSLSKSGGTETLNLNGHNLNATGANPTFDKITGNGNITVAADNTAGLGYNGSTTSSDWSGSLSAGAGAQVVAQNPGVFGTASLTLADGSLLTLCKFNGATVSNPLTMAGRGIQFGDGTHSGAVSLTGSCGMGGAGGSSFDSSSSVVWSGPITLTGNTTVGGDGQFKVTGALSGNYTLAMESGQVGNVNISSSDNQSGTDNGSQTSQTITTTYSANSPTIPVSIDSNNVGIIDGTYGDVNVFQGGTLKGTGTVNTLTAETGAIVAPGHSPGKLTVLSGLTLAGGSTYQAELKDTAAGDYDQLVVGKDTDTTGNDVLLGDTTSSPILSVSLYKGYSIKAGDSFTIINNLSKTDVKGTFKDLPEGATFKVGDDGVFKITYKGGDGNDVVLTVVTAPNTPDTGFALVSANPAATLGVTVLAAGAILLTAHRLRPATARAKVSSRRRR